MQRTTASALAPRVFPGLVSPDSAAWRGWFPEGVGGSVFSSPAFQDLIGHELAARDPGWTQRFLLSDNYRGTLSIPVFVRNSRLGRAHIWTHPLQHYVTPIERARLEAADVSAVLEAADSLFTAAFMWWLAPWNLEPDSARASIGISAPANIGVLSTSRIETYVIERELGWEQYLDQRVHKRHVYAARVSMRRGLEIIERPQPHEIDAYVDLYERSHHERKWSGEQLSRQFFHRAADTLHEGGRLMLMRHEGKVVGGGLLLFDRSAVHYFQGAIDRGVKAVHPHAVLYMEALKAADARGLRYVNLGGVIDDNPGLARYKEDWGARPVAVERIYLACGRRQALRRLSSSVAQALGRGPARAARACVRVLRKGAPDRAA